MRPQLVRCARRVPSALVVVLCAALLMMPSAAHAWGTDPGRSHPSAHATHHLAELAVVPHPERTTSEQHVAFVADVAASAGAYPSTSSRRDTPLGEHSPSASTKSGQFHERAPPAKTDF